MKMKVENQKERREVSLKGLTEASLKKEKREYIVLQIAQGE